MIIPQKKKRSLPAQRDSDSQGPSSSDDGLPSVSGVGTGGEMATAPKPTGRKSFTLVELQGILLESKEAAEEWIQFFQNRREYRACPDDEDDDAIPIQQSEVDNQLELFQWMKVKCERWGKRLPWAHEEIRALQAAARKTVSEVGVGPGPRTPAYLRTNVAVGICPGPLMVCRGVSPLKIDREDRGTSPRRRVVKESGGDPVPGSRPCLEWTHASAPRLKNSRWGGRGVRMAEEIKGECCSFSGRKEGRARSAMPVRASSSESRSDWDGAVGTSGTTVKGSGAARPSYSDMVKVNRTRCIEEEISEVPGGGTGGPCPGPRGSVDRERRHRESPG